ncbi:hypothetical protein BS78_02G196200 [Paspalum vaginatum]|nr:hypothetical protein BS78_02G196200 [Paspalum vaginatum]
MSKGFFAEEAMHKILWSKTEGVNSSKQMQALEMVDLSPRASAPFASRRLSSCLSPTNKATMPTSPLAPMHAWCLHAPAKLEKRMLVIVYCPCCSYVVLWFHLEVAKF